MATKPYIDMFQTVKTDNLKRFEIIFHGGTTRAAHVLAKSPEQAVQQAARILYGPRAFWSSRDQLNVAYELGAVGQIFENNSEERQSVPVTTCNLFITELLPNC